MSQEVAEAPTVVECNPCGAYGWLEDALGLNTQWLKNVVERHGWPGHSLVGRDGAAAAWLLAQHADLDPSFQRRCLDLMTAMPTGEVSPHHIAYLTDRVLLAEGAPQLYGTQVQQVDGVCQPVNLANPESVDQRRASVGLAPLAEYLRHFLDGYR